MKRSSQKDFFGRQSEYRANRISHGGSIAKGKRKLARPLSKRKSLHLILKSSLAREKLSLLTYRNRLYVEKTFHDQAKRFGITVQRFENVGSHLHSVVKFATRESFQNFLRTVSALIARFVTGAKRGKPFGKRFWDELAFTRVITGRRDQKQTETYLDKNATEREFGTDARETVETFEKRRRSLQRQSLNELKDDGSIRTVVSS